MKNSKNSCETGLGIWIQGNQHVSNSSDQEVFGTFHTNKAAYSGSSSM